MIGHLMRELQYSKCWGVGLREHTLILDKASLVAHVLNLTTSVSIALIVYIISLFVVYVPQLDIGHEKGRLRVNI